MSASPDKATALTRLWEIMKTITNYLRACTDQLYGMCMTELFCVHNEAQSSVKIPKQALVNLTWMLEAMPTYAFSAQQMSVGKDPFYIS